MKTVWKILPAAILGVAITLPWSTAEGQNPKKRGKIVHGMMFKHIDRDGDGLYEEWIRGAWRHVDSNRDGKPDVFFKGTGMNVQMGWDSDFDGIYDTAQDLTSRDPIEWTFEYPIEIFTPAQALKRDRVRKVEYIAPAKPRLGLL